MGQSPAGKKDSTTSSPSRKPSTSARGQLQEPGPGGEGGNQVAPTQRFQVTSAQQEGETVHKYPHNKWNQGKEELQKHETAGNQGRQNDF